MLQTISEALGACDSEVHARLLPTIESERALMFAAAAYQLREQLGADHPKARVLAVLAREHRTAADAAIPHRLRLTRTTQRRHDASVGRW